MIIPRKYSSRLLHLDTIYATYNADLLFINPYDISFKLDTNILGVEHNLDLKNS